MSVEKDYERIGKCIYTAYRHGGDVSDVHNWMAHNLGIARPNTVGEAVPIDLYSAFFAKYASSDVFQANYERFVEVLRAREG